MTHRYILSIVCLLGVLAGCEDAHTTDTKSCLVGTWIAESTREGATTRRTMTIQPDGRVKEAIHVAASSGVLNDQLLEGEWSFDGANFKRKYTYVDGTPLTNVNFIYETYELRSVTNSSLVAVSNVGRGEIRFQRVAGKSN